MFKYNLEKYIHEAIKYENWHTFDKLKAYKYLLYNFEYHKKKCNFFF